MLTLRQSNIGPPVYAHLLDYDVMEDGQSIGRIYASARELLASPLDELRRMEVWRLRKEMWQLRATWRGELEHHLRLFFRKPQ
jgi:hypothetical protein